MAQAREQPRLALETSPPLFTFKELFRQYLQRHHPVDAGVLRPVDLPHPPRPDGGEDLVGAELRAGRERHGNVATQMSPSLTSRRK